MNYIDLHCDTIMALMDHLDDNHLKDVPLQVNVNKLKQGNCLLQCFAMFVHLKKTSNPLERCIQMIDRFYEELNSHSEELALVLEYEDLDRNRKDGKISCLLTVEEGAVTKSDLAYLRTLHRLGVRMICLNWNFENGIGYPNFILNTNPDFTTPNTTHGLTAYGKRMVREMNRLGMIVDVSHLSDKGFYDCIELSSKPIVASHSNARSVCHHVRNLTDEMILSLMKTGGVMGLNFCAAFLDDDEEKGKDTVPCLLRHLQYIKELAGVEVLAIGSDFDGISPDISLQDASFMPKLFEAMRLNGWTEEEIEQVAYKNFLRVLKANLT